MKNTLLALTIALTVQATAMAQSTATLSSGSSAAATTSTSGSFLNRLEESPLSMQLLFTADAERDKQRRANGISSTDIIYLGYKLSDNDKIRMENRWTFENSRATRDENGKSKVDKQWARNVLKYTRSNILTEAKNGVNMSASLEQRTYPSTASRGNKTGLTRISTNLNKSFSNGISVSNSFYYAKYNTTNKNPGTTTQYYYLTSSQDYSFTDTLSLSLLHEYIKLVGHKGLSTKGDKVYDTESYDLTLEMAYAFNPKVTGAVSVNGNPMVANDGKTIRQDWLKEFGFGASVFVSAF
jgi:hypothetical protein